MKRRRCAGRGRDSSALRWGCWRDRCVSVFGMGARFERLERPMRWWTRRSRWLDWRGFFWAGFWAGSFWLCRWWSSRPGWSWCWRWRCRICVLSDGRICLVRLSRLGFLLVRRRRWIFERLGWCRWGTLWLWLRIFSSLWVWIGRRGLFVCLLRSGSGLK